MRKFEATDFKDFKLWHEKRGMTVPNETTLPKLGFVEPGVAAGFLIQTDCRIGFLDFFVANPDRSHEERIKALDEISAALIESAEDLGIKLLMCNTQFSSLKALAEKHTFTYLGEYSSYSRGIK